MKCWTWGFHPISSGQRKVASLKAWFSIANFVAPLLTPKCTWGKRLSQRFKERNRKKLIKRKTNQITQITLPEFGDPFSSFTTASCSVSYKETSAPCPAVSRILQLPRITPLGKPFFFTYSFKLPTIVSVGFSATPWNFLKPVTWIVTAWGPSDPMDQSPSMYFNNDRASTIKNCY